ncbi:MAG: lysylphosphatidylglycerol synthase transmembrane domain-containing protein [Mycobacteriales bacterium]
MTGRRPRMTPLRRRLLAGAGFVAFVAVASYVIYSSGSELTQAAQALSRVNPGWLVVAGVVEAGSFVAFAQGQRIFLEAGGSEVGLAAMTGIATAGQAIANLIPAGVAASSVYTFRQLRNRGVSVVVSAEVQVAQSLIYVATLALLALLGTAIAGGTAGVADLQYVALVLLAGAAALLAAGVWLVRRGAAERGLRHLARWLGGPAGDGGRALRLDRRVWLRATVAGMATWGFDFACLAASFAAVGAAIPWRGLLLAYCAGQLAAMLPVSPGGLGVVEGSLTVALVAFGGSEPVTLAAVLLYRLFSYWAVLPSGAASHLLVRRQLPVPSSEEAS